MADITITIPDAQVPRVRAALTDYFRTDQLDPPRQAGVPEFKALVGGAVKQAVRKYERRLAEQAARDAVTDIDVS